MRELLLESWRRIQPELKARAGAAAYAAWLAELKPLAIERGVVHLEARNRMVKDRVERLYRDVIADCLEAEVGTRLGVDVEPAPESLLPDQLEVGPQRPVVDASNRTAVLALTAVLEGRPMPSPLFLFHGAAGSGKSFVIDWWRGLWRGRGRVRRFDGPQLVKAFQSALRERRIETLRAELERNEPLVVDEVHRLAGHRRVQIELAKVLEVRRGLSAPTVLASRWHPREIRDLEPLLETWLLAGFVARIDQPGPVARLAYLRALEGAAARNGRGPAVEDLARRLGGGYPELRRGWAAERHGLQRAPRSWQLIEPRSAFERMLGRVSAAFEIDAAELCGESQRRRTSQARKILSWLCVREGLSRAEVGRFLGNRTRAAISYAIKSLEADMDGDGALRREVEALL